MLALTFSRKPQLTTANKRDMEKSSVSKLATRLSAACLILATAGCTGVVGSDQNPGTGSPGAAGTVGGGQPGGAGSSSGGAASTACNPDTSLASARVWRITDEQYVNTVRQTFGVTPPAAVSGVQVDTADFMNLSELGQVTDPIARSYENVARLVAQQAVTSHLKTFLPCNAESCVEQFIRNRVSRAFGRPVTEEETQGLLGLYRSAVQDGPGAGVQLIIEAALQAPSFLYRTELGPVQAGGPTAKTTLTPFEVATALSYSLLDSAPDDTLWDKAENGSLAKPEVLSAEVDRLLSLPAVQKNISHKAGFWLGVEKIQTVAKDETKFPEYTTSLKNDLYQSAKLFIEDVFSKGTVNDLLSSKRMYLNESLAKVYDLQVPAGTGQSLVPVEVSTEGRGLGILSQPAVMAATSRPDKGDPIHRGLFLYYALACGQPVPGPPPNALDVQNSFPKNLSEREYAGLRAATSPCKNCHLNFDPLGLATERYDPIGRYRASDANGPIDASSTLKNLGAMDGPITGLPELAERLKLGRVVSDCAVTNLTPYVLGLEIKDRGTPTSVANSCALQTVKDKFAATGAFPDFYRALFGSPAFVTRDPAAQ